MKVAAITITKNRLDLTKKTVESFYARTSVDFHLFVDNGSSDGTQKYLEQFHRVELGSNKGITEAFKIGLSQLKGYDFILKLDNDIETVTDNIIARMLEFYSVNGPNFVCSPVDLNLDPAFAPICFKKTNLKGFNVSYVTHTGGAFQLIPYHICERLVKERRHFKAGDYMIGKYYKRHGYKPVYLDDLEMRHIGINQSCDKYVL